MLSEKPFVLPTLSRWHKAKMLTCAEKVLTLQQQMITNTGKNILHYSLQKQRRYLSLKHYPKGDRIDRTTGAQYFYHCHRENKDTQEHGHFHCFLRYKHISKRTKPKPLSDWKKHLDNPMTHLVAISMNRYGQPIRLFTVNRWITAEIWYDSEHIERFVKKYQMTMSEPPYWAILDHWVDAMIHLFSPQIIWLHQQRDIIMHHHQSQDPEHNIYEDRTIEELSEIPIDIASQIQWILQQSVSPNSNHHEH
ncbi:MAG: hypothetical protein NTW94_01185 [Legionellales bacterium]|nr:hypothetical protein [Legionellales bacterium]